MPESKTTTLYFDGRSAPASILPAMRHDGMHYELSVRGFPRFFMRRTELDRYDAVPDEEGGLPDVPYGLVLAASDAIEALERRA